MPACIDTKYIFIYEAYNLSKLATDKFKSMERNFQAHVETRLFGGSLNTDPIRKLEPVFSIPHRKLPGTGRENWCRQYGTWNIGAYRHEITQINERLHYWY